LNALPSDEEFRAAPNYGKKEIVERLIGAVHDQPYLGDAGQLAAELGNLLSDRYFAAALQPSGRLSARSLSMGQNR